MPSTSMAERGRPNMNWSISGSQARKRGQARVHDVQPRSPCPQPPGPSLLLEVERLVDVLGVLVTEHVMGAGHDTAGAAGAQPLVTTSS